MIRGLAVAAALLLATPALAASVLLPDAVQKSLTAPSVRAAQTGLEAALQSSEGEAAQWVLVYLAELRRGAGDVAAARAMFKRAVELEGSTPAAKVGSLGLAVLNAGGGASGNTLASLELLPSDGAPRSLELERWLLVAEARAGDAKGAEAAARARALAPDDEATGRRLAVVEGATSAAPASTPVAAPGARPGRAPAPKPAAEARPTDTPPTAGDVSRLRAALAAADWPQVERLASALAADPTHGKEAAYASRRATTKVTSDPARVAVLLPLTGTYAVPGGNLRGAIELGAARGGQGVVLDVVDTGGDPARCVSALEEAVIERGASLVVGPLLKEEAAACAPAAQALRVPMVALTSSEEPLAVGDHVFRAFPSVEQQVRLLLDEVHGVRGVGRYAILHPANANGEAAAQAFRTAAEARGASVVVVQSYDPNAKDFRGVAKALGKKDYKARASEFASLRAAATRARQDPDKVVLPPIIEYDAIFVPDSYPRTALLASALAFEEFPLGKFRPNREAAPLVLLGLNAWNNDDFARRGGLYVQDAIFVDAWNRHADTATLATFTDDWKARGGGDPTVVEAVGYDVGRLAASAVAEGGGVDGLRRAKLVDPVAGTHGFGPDREAVRDWVLLTIDRTGIVLLTPPAPTAPPEPTP